MIAVTAESTNQAWKETFLRLFEEGNTTDNEKYFRDEVAIIHITNPTLEKIDPLFPMSQEEVDTINRFIITGENEEKIRHEWTKLYYHRMFDEPHSQIEYLIQFLQERPLEGEAIISLWDKYKDQQVKIAPCTIAIWGRVKFGALELHVHAHSSDAYKKLFMNIQEFVSVQVYLAQRLHVTVGNYYHIIDSCHIHTSDLSKVKETIERITSANDY